MVNSSSADNRTLGDVVDLRAWPYPPGRRPSQSRFEAAIEIQVLLREDAAPRDPEHKHRVGIGIYEPVARVNPESCLHMQTICRVCRRQWEQDHFLAVFTHATSNAYRNHGCRCTPCRQAASTAANS
jgi:hypothetical protein